MDLDELGGVVADPVGGGAPVPPGVPPTHVAQRQRHPAARQISGGTAGNESILLYLSKITIIQDQKARKKSQVL